MKGLENLKAGSNKAWKHTPTKAVRIPEIFAALVLEFARSLDEGKSLALLEDLESLPLEKLLEIQAKLPKIIAQKQLENPAVQQSERRLVLSGGEEIRLYHPYDADELTKIKAIQPKGHFNRIDKSWRYPLEAAEALVEMCGDRYEIADAIKALAKLQAEDRKAEEKRRLNQADSAAQELINLINSANLDEPLPCGWTLFEHQKKAVEWLLAHRRGSIYHGGILADHMGLGKAQPIDAKILTPKGWKLMGDIQVGDPVINRSGGSSYVTGVFPQGTKKIYKVIFTDGSSAECCEDHLWAVQTPWMKKYQGKFKVRTLKEIKNSLAYSNGNLKHYIPMVQPVKFEEQDISVDPYLLGCLIGDGGLSSNAVYFSTADNFLLEELSKRLPSEVEIVKQKGDDYSYRLTRGKSSKVVHSLLEDLRELGISGKNAYSKFIPDRYKFSSVKTRVELLQGLMDTDGSISNGVLEFSSSSYQLAKDVQFLIQSLGGRCIFRSRKPWYSYHGVKKQGAISYRLTISLPQEIQPFKLPRKADCYKPREKYLPSRAIKEVLYVGEKEAQCIAVSASDSLYVTDDCVVTHNTLSALTAAKILSQHHNNCPNCPIFVICPASLRENWRREAERVEVTIETFSWAKLPKPLESESYIVIADEAHMAQNLKSQRTQKLLNIAIQQNCLAAWLLTGTPIKNGRPINLFPLLKAIAHPLSENRSQYEKHYCNAHYKDVGRRTVWDNSGAAHLDELAKKTEDCILRRTKSDCLDLPKKQRILRTAELEAKQQKAYTQEISDLVQDYRDRVKRGEIDGDAQALVTLGILRKVGSSYKVGSAVALAEELLEQNQQVVIFTEFLESANLVYSRLSEIAKAEILTGETKQDERQKIVDRFQSGESKVFIGTIKAGGVGLTLTAASNVILVDRPWTPGDAEQAEDRCHRIGQNNSVSTYWIQLGIIDEKIDFLLESKQKRIDLVLKGKRKTLKGLDSPKELAKQLLEIL